MSIHRLENRTFLFPIRGLIFALFTTSILLTACVRPMSQASPWNTPAVLGQPASKPQSESVPSTQSMPTRIPGEPIASPTPDAPHILPTQHQTDEQYTVRAGDTLGKIAQRYGVDINSIVSANQIPNPDILEIGVTLIIPAGHSLPPGPGFKIIPDSELVNGPAAAKFDIKKLVTARKGFLFNYREEVEKRTLTGADIVTEIAHDYSVNPRLLLAVLEDRSGWVTQTTPNHTKTDFPLGFVNSSYKGLYRQLSWAANNLNRGYYMWKAGGVSAWILADGSMVPPEPTLNAGTAAAQYFYSLLLSQADWEKSVGPEGLAAIFTNLFGYPFDYAVEPIVPPQLTQPSFQLPFEPESVWSFTGGPHGGWGSGSGWAAIDFAPPGDALGCQTSNAWVTAMAAGRIVRADRGAVIEDLDGDGLEQTGWTILYMHIESRDRIRPGTEVKPGERIGHPSCEGGISNGTHTHLARRYNGEWIPADGGLPFNLDGWISKGDGVEYNGWLINGDRSVEAWDGRVDENQISR